MTAFAETPMILLKLQVYSIIKGGLRLHGDNCKTMKPRMPGPGPRRPKPIKCSRSRQADGRRFPYFVISCLGKLMLASACFCIVAYPKPSLGPRVMALGLMI